MHPQCTLCQVDAFRNCTGVVIGVAEKLHVVSIAMVYVEE